MEPQIQSSGLPRSASGLLPHAGPMELITRIISIQGEISIHEAIIREDNPFLAPDGTLESSALPEYGAQAAAVRDSVDKGGKPSPGLLTELSKTRFFQTVRQGDLLKITVEKLFQLDVWHGVGFKIECGGEPVAEGELKLCIYDTAQLPF